jgi:hypothetical protein
VRCVRRDRRRKRAPSRGRVRSSLGPPSNEGRVGGDSAGALGSGLARADPGSLHPCPRLLDPSLLAHRFDPRAEAAAGPSKGRARRRRAPKGVEGRDHRWASSTTLKFKNSAIGALQILFQAASIFRSLQMPPPLLGRFLFVSWVIPFGRLP